MQIVPQGKKSKIFKNVFDFLFISRWKCLSAVGTGKCYELLDFMNWRNFENKELACIFFYFER